MRHNVHRVNGHQGVNSIGLNFCPKTCPRCQIEKYYTLKLARVLARKLARKLARDFAVLPTVQQAKNIIPALPSTLQLHRSTHLQVHSTAQQVHSTLHPHRSTLPQARLIHLQVLPTRQHRPSTLQLAPPTVPQVRLIPPQQDPLDQAALHIHPQVPHTLRHPQLTKLRRVQLVRRRRRKRRRRKKERRNRPTKKQLSLCYYERKVSI